MPINKNALLRYKVLDRCFRNPAKRYFIADLMHECEKVLLEADPDSKGISRRQIFEDITFMESKEGWQIELTRPRDGKRVYYRYADPSFSIDNMPLNELEIINLEDAIQTLSQFKGMPQFEWVNELLPKLKQDISPKGVHPTIMEFDSNKYLRGLEHLGELHNAIFYKKILEVSYQPFGYDSPFNVSLHPYFLKQYNSRWFLFGYNPEKDKADWNLAIDRIISIKESKGNYVRNNTIDWQEYFEDIIGVTRPVGGEICEISLLFMGKTGKYIESKPLHGSQKVKWLDADTLRVSLRLIINYELERLILSYADSVKVLEPKCLVKSVVERLKKGYHQY
jgi:predicted DNA-binding transcriptional regulator YafY